MQSCVTITRGHLQKRLERLRLGGHCRPWVAEATEPIRHGRDSQLIGIHLGDSSHERASTPGRSYANVRHAPNTVLWARSD